MRMLSESDLQAIGSIVDVKFDQKIEPVLEAIREGFGAVDRRFEAVDRRFEGIEATMATKTDIAVLRHELMDHTDRTVQKAVGDLRAELRERDLIG